MYRPTFLLILLFILPIAHISSKGKDKEEDEKKPAIYKSSTYSGFKFRSVGPALKSGRVADIAVQKDDPSTYFLAIASGGVWKTNNAGNTFKAIFDGQGSYSIGCVSIDPGNPHCIWVGTGENNNQRSVAYGDGVYKSCDDGNSWENVGLKKSEHISKIIVDPNNSNVVYVAAYGPLWSKGGERGIYKTIDGGKTWKRVLHVDEHTGFADLIMDPSDSDILYASAHQRRRHVFTYIGGGPGSGLHKSTDAGETWFEINKGLPGVDKGRIGLAISPLNRDLLFAIVEASDGKGGFYRSTNRGASWSKRSDYVSSGNYYQEIYCDIENENIVHSMNTFLKHSLDGGKTWKNSGEEKKHVDNHCMWQDPANPDHWRVGCDGGLYETWDRAKNWQYKANLPLTQFYKVAVDESKPFYYIYGGTQDNNSQGGPSGTLKSDGIANSDWFITLGGDGFEPQIDPKDPNIVYSQWQYGNAARYDRISGENMYIQPTPGLNEKPYRWNWDAPLLISPHKNTRLYFAANKLFKSEDRGNSWETLSPDLTQQIDRNKLKVMGKVQLPEIVMKNKSTSIYGTIVALDESPLVEGLIYVGTDDGLIQVTEDGGKNWRKISSFSGVPGRTYVNVIIASLHDPNTVYAGFNNHKNGDFKPYILKSTDRGKSWTSISSDLPERGSVYTIAQDHVKKELFFAGTEFGIFFSPDEGGHWIPLKSGIPTIAIRDIAIQKRENDLVLASFGRGFYVMDDYSQLREVNSETLDKEAHLFSVKKSFGFMEKNSSGDDKGADFYVAKNPPNGATFTYYLKEGYKTKKEERQKKTKEAIKKGEAVPYPTLEDFKKEDIEEKAYLLFVIKDQNGKELRKYKQKPSAGIKRMTWNYRGTFSNEFTSKSDQFGTEKNDDSHIVPPGTYTVDLNLYQDGKFRQIAGPETFEIDYLNLQSLPAEDKNAFHGFLAKLKDENRKLESANSILNQLDERVQLVKIAVSNYPGTDLEMMPKARQLELKLHDLDVKINGDASASKRDLETSPSLMDRITYAYWFTYSATTAPTETFAQNIDIVEAETPKISMELEEIEDLLKKLEQRLDEAKVPYSKGRGIQKED
jgi:photosystem II stability/assembly factor-like uncharacterized protein